MTLERAPAPPPRRRPAGAGAAHRARHALATTIVEAVAVVAPGPTEPVAAAPPSSGDYVVTLKDGVDAATVALCLDRGACSGTPADLMAKVRADAAARPSTYGFDGDPWRPILAPGSATTQHYGHLAYAGGH